MIDLKPIVTILKKKSRIKKKNMDVNKLSIKELKELIKNANLSLDGALEKKDLLSLAEKALLKIGNKRTINCTKK